MIKRLLIPGSIPELAMRHFVHGKDALPILPIFYTFYCFLFTIFCTAWSIRCGIPASRKTSKQKQKKVFCEGVVRQVHVLAFRQVLTCTCFSDLGTCAPCGMELARDTLHDNYCASEFGELILLWLEFILAISVKICQA